MITLNQLVQEQKASGLSDIDIIRIFFESNDMEVEAIEMISEIAQTKVEKQKREIYMMKEWTAYLPSKYLYENYDLDTADMLHTLELDFLMNNRKLSTSRLKWAQENIPNIKKPQVYFVPLIEWLKDNAIQFKNESCIGCKYEDASLDTILDGCGSCKRAFSYTKLKGNLEDQYVSKQ